MAHDTRTYADHIAAQGKNASRHTLPVADLCELARETVPEFRTGEWQLLTCQLSGPLKIGKNDVFEHRISYWAGEQRVVDDMIAKVYRNPRSRAHLRCDRHMRLLWEAGFQPPAPFRVPRVYGSAAKARVLFMQKASGVMWRDVLRDGTQGEIIRATEQAADWLVALHRSNAPLRGANRAYILGRIDKFGEELGAAFPDQAKRLHDLATHIRDEVAKPHVTRPSHGDFHSRNVYLTRGFATVIDFDRLARREPAFDLGYAIGSLLMMTFYESGKFDKGGRAASIFLQRYLDQEPLNLARVNLHISRAILQHTHFGIIMHNPRITTLAPVLDRAETYLAAGAQMPPLVR